MPSINAATVRAILRAMRRIQFSPEHRHAAENFIAGHALDEVVCQIVSEANRLLPKERQRTRRMAATQCAADDLPYEKRP